MQFLSVVARIKVGVEVESATSPGCESRNRGQIKVAAWKNEKVNTYLGYQASSSQI